MIVLVAVIPTFADPPAGSNWTQTFDDGFNGSTLDTAKWNPNSPFGGPANGASWRVSHSRRATMSAR
jgi:hypothetical protein